jgi:hypothetical protein
MLVYESNFLKKQSAIKNNLKFFKVIIKSGEGNHKSEDHRSIMQIWKHKYSQEPQNPNFVMLSELMLFLGVHQVVVLGDRIKLVRLSVEFWC